MFAAILRASSRGSIVRYNAASPDQSPIQKLTESDKSPRAVFANLIWIKLVSQCVDMVLTLVLIFLLSLPRHTQALAH